MELVASDMERTLVTAGAFGLGLVFATTATLAGARLLHHRHHDHGSLVAQVNRAAHYRWVQGWQCVDEVGVIYRPAPTLTLIPLAAPARLEEIDLMPTLGGPFLAPAEVLVIDSFPAVR